MAHKGYFDLSLDTGTPYTPTGSGGEDPPDHQDGGSDQNDHHNDTHQGGNNETAQESTLNDEEPDETSPLIRYDAQDYEEPVSPLSIVPTPETTKRLWPIGREAVKKVWAASKGNNHILLLISIMLLALSSFALIFIYQTENVMQAAANIEVTNIQIDDVSDTGFTAWVSISLDWEYNKVNLFLRALFYPVMSSIGRVTVDNTEPVSVFINFPQSPDAHFYNPTNCQFVLPMDIDFSPSTIGQSITFPVDLDINPYDATKVYNEFLMVKDVLKKPKIQVSTVFQSKFSVKSTRLVYGSYAATIRKELFFDPSNFKVPDYTIEDFSLTPTENSIMGEIEFTFDKPPIFIRSTIGEIEWDIYIPGCEQNLLYIATMTSGKTHFGGMVPVNVDVKATIPELSKKLQKFCTDGFSPINKFTKKALEDEATVFLMARSTSKINEDLPTWLFSFLSNSFQPVTVCGNDFMGGNPVSGMSYRLVNANLLVSNDAEILPQLYSDAGVTLNLPISNENNSLFNLTKIYGDLCFIYDDEIFLKVYLHSWQDIQTYDSTFAVHIRKSNLAIIDEEIVAELAVRYLEGEEFNVLGKAMLDLDVKTPVTNSIFQRIEQETVISVQGQTGLISRVDVTINGLSYIGTSTESQLRFFVDMEVTNPLKIGGGFQFLNLLLEYNGTEIGNIELTEAIVESNFTSNIRPILRFKAEDDESREAINLVVSELISGKEPVIIVKGHDQSCKVPAISKVLSNIALPFKAPSITGSDTDHPGFVVSVTFHLLKSEVEVTAYNPVENQDAWLNINHAKAVYKDIDVAFIDSAPLIRLPPGVSTTQRIPVRIATGAAGDLLRRALNSNVTIHTVANFDIVIGQFLLNLDYEGHVADTVIKL